MPLRGHRRANKPRTEEPRPRQGGWEKGTGLNWHRRPLTVSVGERRELLCVQSWRRWFLSQGGKPSPQRFSKQLNV